MREEQTIDFKILKKFEIEEKTKNLKKEMNSVLKKHNIFIGILIFCIMTFLFLNPDFLRLTFNKEILPLYIYYIGIISFLLIFFVLNKISKIIVHKKKLLKEINNNQYIELTKDKLYFIESAVEYIEPQNFLNRIKSERRLLTNLEYQYLVELIKKEESKIVSEKINSIFL